MTIKLSILDQSPIAEGSTAMESLIYTAELAKKAEEWGYTRFWVSEHHDATTLAGSSPEILMAHLATVTSTIRIGSGGVMLPHYSAYKVAENFKLLEALFPGRIDAGIGRAPGGMPRATYALNDGEYRDIHKFPQQVDDLLMYLHDTMPEDHPYFGLKATPITESTPPVWMLGSSPSSAALAAEKGLPYMFAQFINGEGGIISAKLYRETFQASKALQKPKQAVAVFFACAETEEEAERIVSSLDLSLILSAQGIPSKGTPSPEKAMSYTYTNFEKPHVLENRKRMIIGTPKTARLQIEKLAEEFGADEVMLVMIAYDFQDKLKSYELIAKEMLK
ncbi:LLM class flavin-dependent oxidoreductase [Sporosarcina sp. Marseille-Q4063]|uniref:LLM class flavin-dependent oxidoreductase n=1 Tax=Sporosarcina sp. Marseille-Q4063 TaxID=2810514 RepID=UPI001BAEEC7F|nr:LLM class flavin-dependent oxidoreductase [Sporosarcina sp. Marseille-Q4063]QUW23179.1 LLM class flavin-dependent oxidoreductase [Sporosarcina sp. Marseille-Q4063]